MAEVLEFRNPSIEKGHRAYLRGLSAEDCALRFYRDQGALLEQSRWRGAGAEVDLILREGDRLVFVEVKAGRTFDRAAERVNWAQLHRIMRAAETYAARQGAPFVEIRIDVALVDGQGMVRLLENVSMAA